MTSDGAWTLWALYFDGCPVVGCCEGIDCQVRGLLSFLFFVLKAVNS